MRAADADPSTACLQALFGSVIDAPCRIAQIVGEGDGGFEQFGLDRFVHVVASFGPSGGLDLAERLMRHHAADAGLRRIERRVGCGSRARSAATGSAPPGVGSRRWRACRSSGLKSLASAAFAASTLACVHGLPSNAASAPAARLTVAAMPPKASRISADLLAVQPQPEAGTDGRDVAIEALADLVGAQPRSLGGRASQPAPRSPRQTRRPRAHFSCSRGRRRRARRGAAACRGAAPATRPVPSAPVRCRRSANRWRHCHPSCRRCGSAARQSAARHRSAPGSAWPAPARRLRATRRRRFAARHPAR